MQPGGITFLGGFQLLALAAFLVLVVGQTMRILDRRKVNPIHLRLARKGKRGLVEILLFAVVNLARVAGVHPTTALARANAKFTRRFVDLERLAIERGIALETAGLEVLDDIWNEVKEGEDA